MYKILKHYLLQRIGFLLICLFLTFSNDLSSICVFCFLYLVMHDSIVYVANPKACLKLITVKYKTTPNFKITFINGLLVILYIIGVFATDASIKLLDNESDKVFRSIYIIGGIVIPCALFILCAFFRRRLYMKDVVDDVKTIDEVIGIAARLTEEEDPSYVSIKSFQTIKEAEDE